MTASTTRLPGPDAERWRALDARDASCNGAFVYAVKTTGVFCLPSCPSRRPLPKNVEFFDTPEAAAAAGYRDCLRCKPRTGAPALTQTKILAACRRIETALKAPALAELARQADLSPYHFQRIFKAQVGLSPKQYEKAYRERRLREELARAATITEAIFDAGFQSSAQFYADAERMIGMRPRRRRASGAGETIRLAIGQCSLGAVLIGATPKGVCTISLGDDPTGMLKTFLDDFAEADIVCGDEGFETLVANIVGLVEDPRRDCTLPLDIRGTAFQKKVWQALSTIKPGQTARYAEVAKLIGRPSAVRAVAQACAANRIALAIPCHRIVRSDRSLSGYRWGVERKEMLLTRERAP